VLSAAACALDKNGLLQEPAGDDGGLVDGAGDGASTSGEGGPGDDGGSPGDDGSVADGATGDGPAPDVVPPPPADASPAPVVYDGGTIADPVLSDDAWIAFCVGVTGCFPPAGSISACMGRMPQPLDPAVAFPTPSMIACVGANVSPPNCNAIASCLGVTGPCNPQTPDACTGQTLTTCRSGGLLGVDCTSLGMVCSAGAGNAGCGFGDCFAWQEGQTACAGTYVAKCHAGRYEAWQDCHRVGATCGGSPAGCQPTLGCSNVNCGQLYGNGSFHCSVGPGGTPQCALGNQCTPASADTCDKPGHVASFCNAGVPDTYDCIHNTWPNGCQGGVCSP
jgi:hypothetical protein